MKGAIILGIVSGLALGPCSIAYISPVLSLAMSESSRSGFIYAAGLILAYALGYSLVLVIAGTSAQVFAGFLQSERGDKILRAVNVICGIALICGGIYLIREMIYVVM